MSLQTHPHTQISGIPLLLHKLVQQEGDFGAELLDIVEHYIQRCCRTYYSITYSEQQDIAQEASIKLLIHYEDLKYSISKRWLYVMVKNLCLDTLRKKRSNSLTNHSSNEKTDANFLPSLKDFEPDVRFDSHECLDNVFAYITDQPTGQEDLTIYSHFAYGLSRAEISHITGRTVDAVTKRISVLRARLKTLRGELC